MKSFCGPSPNGDGEKIGRAWSAMFQLAKTRLDIIGGDADDAGCSSQLLLTQLRQGILKEIILALDKSVLDALIHPSGDALANPMIPGGGALTFSAGAELKRAISALASVAKDLNVGTSTESIIPKLRAVADVCMIPKDALIDVKLRTDIVCGKLTDEELASVVSRFRPDDFAPQPVDPDVISAVVDAARTAAAEDEDEEGRRAVDRQLGPSARRFRRRFAVASARSQRARHALVPSHRRSALRKAMKR